VPNVRTTAYTRTESGGAHNALGTYLCGRHVMSAASDWSRFPLGTHFRIADTNEEYVIDDYGMALEKGEDCRPDHSSHSALT